MKMAPPGSVTNAASPEAFQNGLAGSKQGDKSILKEFIRTSLPNGKADRIDIKYAPYSGNYALKGRML